MRRSTIYRFDTSNPHFPLRSEIGDNGSFAGAAVDGPRISHPSSQPNFPPTLVCQARAMRRLVEPWMGSLLCLQA